MLNHPVENGLGSHAALAKAPVAEVVFELQATGTAFSLLPGALVAPLKGLDYPKVRETPLAKIPAFLKLPPAAGILVTHQFFSEDEKNVVQLGPRASQSIPMRIPASSGFEILSPGFSVSTSRSRSQRMSPASAFAT